MPNVVSAFQSRQLQQTTGKQGVGRMGGGDGDSGRGQVRVDGGLWWGVGWGGGFNRRL